MPKQQLGISLQTSGIDAVLMIVADAQVSHYTLYSITKTKFYKHTIHPLNNAAT